MTLCRRSFVTASENTTALHETVKKSVSPAFLAVSPWRCPMLHARVESGGDGSLNCHGYGSVVAVTATFGQCAAGWVLHKIAGVSS